MIALIDYGAGNLTSVRKALHALGAEVTTPREPEALERAAGVIVPGVGHFDVTRAIDAGWRAAVHDAVGRGTPLLGICVGLQWLFEGSDEAPGLPGLGLFPGTCARLPDASLKVPHVGWNALTGIRGDGIVSTIDEGAHVYFTHSYAAPVVPDTVATTVHGVAFTAAVERGHVSGVQFHPEKSGDTGMRVLANWLARIRGDGSQNIPYLHDTHGNNGITEAARARATLSSQPAGISASTPPGPHTSRPPAFALSKRIIACLDVRDGTVVKGVNFEGLRNAGDPAALAAHYNATGIDELVILDVTATLESRQARAQTVASVAKQIFIPLCVGGGIRSEEDAAAAIEAGADKVSVNTAAIERPELITTLAARYGSQAVVVAIDAKRAGGRFVVHTRSGQAATARDAVEWAIEAAARGAGEILLTSIDRDGTRRGFDAAMTRAVSTAVSIPVIASGGAGTFEHFAEIFADGAADAALAASVFHFNEHSVADLKAFLAARGIAVRRR